MANSVISHRSGPFSTVSMGLPGDHEGKTATRTFFVQGSKRLALIDSGLFAGYPSLENGFSELGLSKTDLDLLLITHEHMDHIGNNGPENGDRLHDPRPCCPRRQGGRQHAECQNNRACLS